MSTIRLTRRYYKLLSKHMKLAFIRTKTESTVFARDELTNGALDSASLQQMKIWAKSGSSSKNIIYGLKHYELVSRFEEWKFWNGPFKALASDGTWPVKLFPCAEELTSEALTQYVYEHGQPDVLWVEGPDFPAYLEQIFDLCPDSFKIVYSKDWRPWRIEQLDEYDLCLVDEEWEVAEVAKYHPHVQCAIWDKLIDYEQTHFPIPCEKIYDVCYVAYLRPRKNHELLFHALSKVAGRKLSCVCIGDDRKGNRAELEKLAQELRLNVHFTGEVSKAEVNRYVNQSKVGVMCTVLDAAPRAILEYMAANVPVLVNRELWAGARYVGSQAGLVKAPDEFHLGLAELVENYQSYSPRAYLLENYSFEQVMAKFIGLLREAGVEMKNGYSLVTANERQ